MAKSRPPAGSQWLRAYDPPDRPVPRPGLALWWLTGQYQTWQRPAGEERAEAGHFDRLVRRSPRPASSGATRIASVIRSGRHRSRRHGQGDHDSVRRRGWQRLRAQLEGLVPARTPATTSPKFRSLVFHIRQVTDVADADLTIHLVDNVKRDDKSPAGNGAVGPLGRRSVADRRRVATRGAASRSSSPEARI